MCMQIFSCLAAQAPLTNHPTFFLSIRKSVREWALKTTTCLIAGSYFPLSVCLYATSDFPESRRRWRLLKWYRDGWKTMPFRCSAFFVEKRDSKRLSVLLRSEAKFGKRTGEKTSWRMGKGNDADEVRALSQQHKERCIKSKNGRSNDFETKKQMQCK